MNYRAIITTSLLLLLSPASWGADLAGLWKQYDDSGTLSSLIRISERSSGLYDGVVEHIFPDPGEPADPVCKNCTGELHNKPVLGMRIIFGIKHKDANTFDVGKIIDPDNGKTYRCRIELALDGSKIKVNGSIGPAWLGRMEVWQRAE